MTQPMTQQQHYAAMIQATTHVIEKLKHLRAEMAGGSSDPSVLLRLRQFREDMAENFNRFQRASVSSIQALDQAIAEKSSPPSPASHAQAIELIDQAIGKEGEALHHLYGMMQGRPIAQTPQAPAPNRVEASEPASTTHAPEVSVPPMVQSQVAEVVEKDGTKTVFENGQPIASVTPNGVVIPAQQGPTVQ